MVDKDRRQREIMVWFTPPVEERKEEQVGRLENMKINVWLMTDSTCLNRQLIPE